MTRGGTQFTIGTYATPTPSPSPSPSQSPAPSPGPVVKVTGGGSILGKTVNFGFNAFEPTPSGHLNYLK